MEGRGALCSPSSHAECTRIPFVTSAYFSLVVPERLPHVALQFLYFTDRKVPETLRTNSEKACEQKVLNTFFKVTVFIVLVKVGLGDYFKFFFFFN